jgi:streptogramin lyase
MLMTGSSAMAGAFESLGKPCRGFNVLATRVVRAPDGKEYFVLSNTNETSGVELIFIDFKNNTARKFPAPAGSGAWLLNPVPGDRLVVGTYYDGKLMVFDLKTMKFTNVIPFPGEQYFWNGALGSDGRLYGGTYPGAKLGALDLKTFKLEDCGAPAPPNLYCRNVSATPDGRLLCNFTTTKQVTKLFDPAGHQWSDVPAQLKNVQRSVVWNGYLLAATNWEGHNISGPIAFKGKDFQPVDPPPFPLPPADGGSWSVDLFLTSPEALYLKQGSTIWRYRKGEQSLVKVFDQDLKSGAMNAVASDGTLLGIRGQDYLIARPGETTARLIPIPIEASPRPMHWIRTDNHGKLWGGPHFGQTIFSVDLKSGKSTNTGIVCNAGGEVYDAAFKDGKIYLVAYVGGDIVQYDPSQPWAQLEGKNPKTIAHLTTQGYIRPVGGIVVAPDGKLYSGWMASYGTFGGAIAITDTQSGKTTLIKNPLGKQAISGLAVDEKCIYAGTILEGNGLGEQKNVKPQFGVLDRASGKVILQQDYPGQISRMVLDRKTGKLVILSGGRLRYFDTRNRQFSDAPADVPKVNEIALDGTGDGTVWLGSGASVVKLDLESGGTEKFPAPGKVERISAGTDGSVFIAVGPDLYRMRS